MAWVAEGSIMDAVGDETWVTCLQYFALLYSLERRWVKQFLDISCRLGHGCTFVVAFVGKKTTMLWDAVWIEGHLGVCNVSWVVFNVDKIKGTGCAPIMLSRLILSSICSVSAAD